MNKPVCVLALLLSACSYPIASVKTVDAQPTLRVSGAPPAAILIIDQKQAGLASVYADGSVLEVPHGTHRIEIRLGNDVLYRNDVYFGDDTLKTVTLTPGVR